MALSAAVLVVEDDLSNRETLQALLEYMGCTTKAAASGEEGLQMLRDGVKFDVAITDLNMPGMTGLQFSSNAATMRPGLPIILVTGDVNASEAALDKGLLAIAKPYTPATLEALLTEVLHVDDAAGV